jgi:hypothetical protein
VAHPPCRRLRHACPWRALSTYSCSAVGTTCARGCSAAGSVTTFFYAMALVPMLYTHPHYGLQSCAPNAVPDEWLRRLGPRGFSSRRAGTQNSRSVGPTAQCFMGVWRVGRGFGVQAKPSISEIPGPSGHSPDAGLSAAAPSCSRAHRYNENCTVLAQIVRLGPTL